MSKDLRIGLYICHCGHNIAGVISPEALAEQARGLPGVAVCRDHLYSCSEAGQKDIAKDIQQFGLNRMVVAACSPKLHEPTFRRLLAENGVNPYLLEIVNIREHCSWVHAREPEAATVKALELIRMGLAKVREARPLAERQVPLTRAALVIGGGPAGLRAALDIAHAGIPVTLVERAPVLGGMANRLYKTFPQGQSIVSLINPMMAAATLNPGITVLTDSSVTGVGGHLGNYRVKVTQARPRVTEDCDLCGECAAVCPVEVPDDREPGRGLRAAIYRPSPTAFPARYVVDALHCDRCGLCVPACPRQAITLTAEGEIEHTLDVGSIVVATGFAPFTPAGSRYEAWAALPQVITTVTLERLLDPQGPTGGRVLANGATVEPQDIAFVLCVGSREEEGNRYCSRVCCPTALKQALELKARLPQARIRIYYRDIRTVKKEWEALYNRAREAGIGFMRARVRDIRPGEAGSLVIEADQELGQWVSRDRVDLMVLAVGMTPGDGATLREVLKLPVGPDGFFMESHPKLRPLETVLDGIYLAGACQGPKDLAESITQGSGAAGKILALMAHDTITLDGLICVVDPELCIGCETCFQECPFQAVEMVGEGKTRQARIIEAACKGCGVCAGACPSNAVIARGFTDEMILAQIDEALAVNPEEKILAFCCNWCSYAGADFAGVSRMQYPPAVRIIRTMCAGRVHPKFILHAFARGAGQVLVSGCHPPGDCHYVSGNLRAQARIEKLRPKLAKEGIDPARLRLEWISATEGKTFQRVIQAMAEEIEGKRVKGEKGKSQDPTSGLP
ncbi:MAG: hydrogenase iron-sulfur subunit [Desulfobacterales bacterium]|nr:hydrogenase iron-sulfur subunit [Desulfobacterales bacterium]